MRKINRFLVCLAAIAFSGRGLSNALEAKTGDLSSESPGPDKHEVDKAKPGSTQTPNPMKGPAEGMPTKGGYADWIEKKNPDSLIKSINVICSKPMGDEVRKGKQIAWCRKYWQGDSSTLFPLDIVLAHSSLTLTVYLAAPGILDQALKQIADSDPLRALQDPRKNALGAASAAAAIGFDLDGMAEKIINGLVIALKTRAQQEAASVVLDQFAGNICLDSISQRYLKRTCALSKIAGAFNAGLSSGGLSSIQLLRHTLIEDLRHMPAVFASELLKKTAGLREAAPAAENLVNAILVGGTHPFKALDRFADQTDKFEEPRVRFLSCAADFPSSLLDYGALVDASTRGGKVTLEDKNAAVLGLILWQSPCNWSIADGIENPEEGKRIKTLARNHARLENESRAISKLRADLEVLVNKPDSSVQLPELADDVLALAGHTADLLSQIDSTHKSNFDPALDAIAKTREMIRAMVSIQAGEFGAAWASLLSLGCVDGKAGSCVKLNFSAVKYAGLIISIAEADSASQVSDALLAAAAPLGSWKEKYDSNRKPSSVSIGGMLGAGGGWVHAERTDHEWQPAVMGTIGVDYVFLPGKLFYLGVSAQLLDLGAYLKPEKNGLQMPRPMQVVSPGGSFKLGLFKLPVAAVAGLAYDFDSGTPLSGKDTPESGFRIICSLGMDIPLFVLH